MNEQQMSTFRRDKLGFIFQDYNLLDTLTIRENIIASPRTSETPSKRNGREISNYQ